MKTSIRTAALVIVPALGLATSDGHAQGPAKAPMAAPAAAMPAAAPAAMPAPPPGPPKPTQELKDFGAWFVGTWKCEAKWNASPFGPAHPAKATVVTKWSNGGFWIVDNYKEQKTKDNPMPLDVTDWIGHDGTTFRRVGFDNFGGMSIGAGTWAGDKLPLAGEATLMGGKKGPSALTFTKKGPKESAFAATVPGPDGKPFDLGGGTCKK